MTNNKNNIRYGTRMLAQGVEVSNDTRLTGLNNNDLIVGSSGCGKTGGYVVPGIQHIDGSLVVSDTKGQLERRFGKGLREKGYEVYTLDLVNPMRSCCYNPMAYIRKYRDGSFREQDILSLARLLCPLEDHSEPIWELSAANYIAFLISYCLETESLPGRNLLRVYELHRQFSQADGDLQFLEWINAHPDTFAARKYSELMANRPADKMWASIEGFVNTKLEPYSFREAKYLFCRGRNSDIKSLGRRKTVLFLNVSDTDRTFDRISDVFYAQALQVLCAEADSNPEGRLRVPVRLILDDFAASARIPNFDKIISVIRSRDISVSLIIQSLSQLESIYSVPVSRTILNNCDHILFMGNRDFETARYIGNCAGKTPETILSMPRDKAYLVSTGEKARLVTKIKPYSTEEYTRRDKNMPDGNIFQKTGHIDKSGEIN